MAIKWAPDSSTFTTDPNAIWRTTTDWETRTPVSGFYRQLQNLDPYGSSDPQFEAIQAPVNPAQALLSSGNWNLSDPSIQRYLDHLAYTDFGGQATADWRNSPAALATLLGRLGATTQQMTDAQRAFTGEVDPTSLFGGALSPAQLQAAEQSRKLQQHEANKGSGGLSGIVDAAGDWWSGANDFIVPAALSALGMSYLGGAGAGSAAAGTGGAAAELTTPEWLSGLLAETGEAGVGAGALESGFSGAGLGSAALGGGTSEGSMLLDDAFSFDDPSFGGLIDDIDFGLMDPIAQGVGWSSVLSKLGGLIPNGLSGLMPSGDALNTAAATVPILAAINYARNQGPFDTSRLTSTYDQFDPNALAYEYDQNTARGRNQLTSSLAQRGVMGSSFGNMDLTNFQTSRDLGRRSLINQGLAQRGNIAATLLDAEAKARGLKNDLYGRSLLALGNVFGGRNQAPVYA